MFSFVRNNSVQINIRKNQESILAYVILLIVLVLFAVFQNDFFTKYGPQSLFNQVISLCIATFGQTLVILTAGIDLSVGAIIGLTNSIAATVMVPIIHGVGNEWVGILLTCVLVVVVGTLAGYINAAIIVFGRLQPIIVTLATSSVYTGIALYVRPTPGGKVPDNFTEYLTGRLIEYIPVSAIVLCMFIAVAWIPIRRSRLGQSLYAVGGNENSAYVSGILVGKTKLLAYTLSGFFSACAGILLTAQTASGDPLGSDMFTLNSIAAVVLGGTSLFGGKGGYLGSVAGASILSLIVGLLIFWNVSSFYQELVRGLILILAIAVGTLQARRRKRSLARTS
ncbi:ABC transporter permease [Fodinisporobacter ferrooxydans]|uniref:ABC transporter permease n=1 Tax=Fodinisporobacter ferrooxydans TaxID=2901836 RepID=A0ABY4CRW1_9BACL|nr:ABC transporter permease [Alicyclobacillaceae bacterium MYW30-H2]